MIESFRLPDCINGDGNLARQYLQHTGMAIRVVEFSNGGTQLERFLPKNQHNQRKLLNFENWVNKEVSKIPKFDQNLSFKVNFLCQKSFSIFFH